EPVQGIHPEDHLFERATGNRAHDDRAALVQRHAGRREPRPFVRRGDGGAEAGDRRHHRLHATIAERAPVPALVPAGLRAADGDLHALPPAPPDAIRSSTRNDRFSTPGSSRPARNTRPEARLLTTTSAGLNSMRSIL